MKYLVLFSVLSVVAARPGGLYDPWGGSAWGGTAAVVAQPSVAVSQPLIHAAPAFAVAKPAATSYSSFQQVVHPVAVHAAPVVSQPYVHAPVVSQPYVHATPVVSQPYLHAPVVSQPYVQAPVYARPIAPLVAQSYIHSAPSVAVSQPVVQAISQPVYAQKYLSVGSVGHGW